MTLACAPRVDGPADQQRAHDRIDETRLAAQVGALPGVVKSEVVLRRALKDPLATAPPVPGMLSLVIVVDDRADRAAITAHATQLAQAIAPDTRPAIVVDVGATRATLAKVGPFAVEAASQKPLKATLAIAFATIAALAGAIARERYRAIRRYRRRGNSAQ